MSNALTQYIGKRILHETVANNFGAQDPYFEQVPVTRLGRKTFKKKRKALPPGISAHDGQVLTKVKRRAYRLDLSLFNCCGIRFGWSSVIALIPFAGDALDAFMAYMVVNTCGKVEGGLPESVRIRMLLNIALDFGIGLVPFLGDIADAMFRCNTRNAAILESYLREKGKKNLRQSGMPMPAVDPSDPAEFDREHPPEYTAHEPPREGTMSARPQNARNDSNGVLTPKAPPPAVDKSNSRSSGGFFGFGSKSRPHDVEMGNANDRAGTSTNPR